MTIARALIFLITTLLLLTGCGGVLSVEIDRPNLAVNTVEALQTQIATMQPVGPLLSLQSDSETIRRALLNSSQRWNRLWVSGQLTEYVGSTGADSQTIMFQAWIDQPNARFRLLQGRSKAGPEVVQISDGANITRIELQGGTTTQDALPEDVRAPFSPPLVVIQDTIIPHPLIRLMDTTAQPVFYPGDLAQQGGEFRPVEVTSLAGSPALVVEWQHGQVLDTLWIDSETGHLLGWQSHGKGEPFVTMEVKLNMIAYNPSFSSSLFDARLSEAPQYVSQPGELPTPEPAIPPSGFLPGEGQLYFVANGASSGLNLFRLPSSCISGQATCRAPAVVPGYPNTGSSIEPMYWSPDGSLAAVLIYDQVERVQVLWLYHPADETWSALARFPILSGPVVWSPDSYWLSFSAKIDPNGTERLFATSRDGERNYDFTGGPLSKEDARISPVAWINNQTVLFLFVDQNNAQLYTARPDKSLPEPLNLPRLRHGLAALSPDRTQIAYSVQDGQGASEVWLSGLDGSNANRLINLQSTSLQQLEWSPDGSQLAFLTLSTNGLNTTAAIYTVDSDGSNLRVVYQSASLARIAFAPDAPYLVAEDNQISKLVIIPLDGSPAAILSAPGLRLEDQLLGISWRDPQ